MPKEKLMVKNKLASLKSAVEKSKYEEGYREPRGPASWAPIFVTIIALWSLVAFILWAIWKGWS